MLMKRQAEGLEKDPNFVLVLNGNTSAEVHEEVRWSMKRCWGRLAYPRISAAGPCLPCWWWKGRPKNLQIKARQSHHLARFQRKGCIPQDLLAKVRRHSSSCSSFDLTSACSPKDAVFLNRNMYQMIAEMVNKDMKARPHQSIGTFRFSFESTTNYYYGLTFLDCSWARYCRCYDICAVLWICHEGLWLSRSRRPLSGQPPNQRWYTSLFASNGREGL